MKPHPSVTACLCSNMALCQSAALRFQSSDIVASKLHAYWNILIVLPQKTYPTEDEILFQLRFAVYNA